MVQDPLPPDGSNGQEGLDAQIAQNRKMAIVGELTGGVVHDFNNILTVISGTIEILAEAVADRPDLAAIARLIDEAAARGANLTSHLLAFARGQSSPPREVDVNAVVVDAARLLRPTLGEQIEIDPVPATGVSLALVDPHQLMTAILHLAIMARDAMPEGGRLAIEAESTVAEGGGADAGSEAGAGDGVMVAVSAFRHGISPGHADRLFADLGIVNDFVKQSNGHISVCGETGAETSVKIYLPRATGVTRPLIEGAIAGGDETILIVEDDALVRRYVMIQVQSLGYRTFAAGNASEALAIIDQAEKIDLLFADVVLPGSIDGWQLAIEALNRRPALKVLYTSGYARSAIAPDRHLDADVLLLAKPYRKVELAKMIRAALTA
ncbi:MAG TPA: response regulator [Pseudolabrys sp.]|nr:response regulator [Pseudolabrys sp.]